MIPCIDNIDNIEHLSDVNMDIIEKKTTHTENTGYIHDINYMMIRTFKYLAGTLL